MSAASCAWRTSRRSRARATASACRRRGGGASCLNTDSVLYGGVGRRQPRCGRGRGEAVARPRVLGARHRAAARRRLVPAGGFVTRAVWPGRPFPLGPDWDGDGTNFSLFSENAEAVELCLFDEAGNEERIAGRGAHGLQLALLPAGRRPGPALRLPGARAVRPAARQALQPGEAADRPLRQGDRRARSTGTPRTRCRTSRRRRKPISRATTRTPRRPSPSAS